MPREAGADGRASCCAAAKRRAFPARSTGRWSFSRRAARRSRRAPPIAGLPANPLLPREIGLERAKRVDLTIEGGGGAPFSAQRRELFRLGRQAAVRRPARRAGDARLRQQDGGHPGDAPAAATSRACFTRSTTAGSPIGATRSSSRRAEPSTSPSSPTTPANGRSARRSPSIAPRGSAAGSRWAERRAARLTTTDAWLSRPRRAGSLPRPTFEATQITRRHRHLRHRRGRRKHAYALRRNCPEEISALTL